MNGTIHRAGAVRVDEYPDLYAAPRALRERSRELTGDATAMEAEDLHGDRALRGPHSGEKLREEDVAVTQEAQRVPFDDRGTRDRRECFAASVAARRHRTLPLPPCRPAVGVSSARRTSNARSKDC
jgi:hypothetical protein